MFWWERVEAKLDLTIRLLRQVLQEERIMSVELDNLEAQVKMNTDAEQSAIMLLGKLSDMIKAAGTDPVKLRQLTADLDASKQKLADAILANTPAESP